MELNEALYKRKNKYPRGHDRGGGQWVFGIIERKNSKVMLWTHDVCGQLTTYVTTTLADYYSVGQNCILSTEYNSVKRIQFCPTEYNSVNRIYNSVVVSSTDLYSVDRIVFCRTELYSVIVFCQTELYSVGQNCILSTKFVMFSTNGA